MLMLARVKGAEKKVSRDPQRLEKGEKILVDEAHGGHDEGGD